jgi:hypothetical protein
MARFHKKVEPNPDGPHKPETFTIKGPDNKVLKTMKVDDNGETNDDAGSQFGVRRDTGSWKSFRIET